MDAFLVIFLVIILLIGGIVFVMIAARGRLNSALDVDKFRSSWMSISQQLTPGNAQSHVVCVLNADKLLDKALRDSGFKGETMGERMKSAHKTWSDANAVWAAHKLRNRLAHEHDARISYDEARRALYSFKQGLKDLGAI